MSITQMATKIDDKWKNTDYFVYFLVHPTKHSGLMIFDSKKLWNLVANCPLDEDGFEIRKYEVKNVYKGPYNTARGYILPLDDAIKNCSKLIKIPYEKMVETGIFNVQASGNYKYEEDLGRIGEKFFCDYFNVEEQIENWDQQKKSIDIIIKGKTIQIKTDARCFGALGKKATGNLFIEFRNAYGDICNEKHYQ